MKTVNVIFILFLCLLEKISSQVPFDTICPDCPKIVLGKTEESISYKSTEGECKCSWTLPKTLQESDSFSVAVIRINASIKMAGTDLCTGFLIFPDVPSSCDEGYLCQIYHAPTTKCKKSEVLKIAKDKGLHCDNYQSYNDKPSQQIEYITSVTPGEKKFNLRYIPIGCNSESVATPATTQTNSIEATTTNPDRMTSIEIEATNMETTTASYKRVRSNTTATSIETTAGIQQTIKSNTTQSFMITAEATNHNTTTEILQETGDSNKSSTTTFETPGSLNNTISIVVPLAILLGLLIITTILIFLWRRGKKKPRQPAQDHETEKFIEVNADEGMAQTGI